MARNIWGFEKSNYSVWLEQIQGKRAMVRKIEGSKNRIPLYLFTPWMTGDIYNISSLKRVHNPKIYFSQGLFRLRCKIVLLFDKSFRYAKRSAIFEIQLELSENRWYHLERTPSNRKNRLYFYRYTLPLCRSYR